MAVRITLKRSSIYNKRPNAEILDPGELALNTNALTPGLFFEADNNEVIKVGPTQVGPEPPVPNPSLGESWYNEITGELNIGSLSKLSPAEVRNIWQRVSSPYLGGTNGYVVFVASEFPNATDNLYNNGQANPFQTVNRAVIEIAKQSIIRQNELDDGQNNRYTIVVAPGRTPVYNDPGLPIGTANSDTDSPVFDVNFDKVSASGGVVDIQDLVQFNPETGGLLLPRGTSVVGMDLRKTNITPSYVPDYKNPVNGVGFNEPITSILKWTGNSYVTDLTFRDKNPEVFVNTFRESAEGLGILVSTRPHGLAYNDKVFVDFSPAAKRSPIDPQNQGVSAGFYFVKPISVYEFEVSTTNLDGPNPNFIERGQLPQGDQGLGYILSVTYDLSSHHRLRCLLNASFAELTEFYQKIQYAFPAFFNERVDQANVANPGETEIVAPTFTSPSGNLNLESNLNTQASPYARNCSVKSMYGLCAVEQNGSIVSGFRSAQATAFTVASLQRDPYAYEVYATISSPDENTTATKWYPLAEVAWNSLAPSDRPQFPVQVPREVQLRLLNQTPITNIRYYYLTQTNPQGLSYGIVDTDYDFRHFGFRATNGGYLQIDTGWCICTAVGFWSLNGGAMTVTNSSNNFGSIGNRSEGFSGIGTLGGALPEDQGFVFSGIRMPQALLPSETTNQLVFSLNANVISVTPAPGEEDNDNSLNPDAIQLINLGLGFEPISLLPFSLAPNSAVWITTPQGLVRGFFADDGLTTTILNDDGTTTLRIRLIDSSIPMTSRPDGWGSPYIKRFDDERPIADKSYSLILTNSLSGHRSPKQSSVLRLTQTTPSNNNKLIRPLVQFDPGPNGGWGRLFQVMYSEGSFVGDSGQVNEVMINRFSSQDYYVGLSLADGARPWAEQLKYPHGSYSTYEERNWYAAANDIWSRVYYSDKIEPIALKLVDPPEFNSVYAISACTEVQLPVQKTFQGTYGADPFIPEYGDRDTYFRGSQTNPSNYNFNFYFNEDNGTPSFGLLRYTQNTSVVTTTTETVAKGDRIITLDSGANIPNPRATFVVVKLRDSKNTRIEYVQVLGIDPANREIAVSRGLYGTEQTADWPAGTTVILQTTAASVDPRDYDLDWMPSKSAMIRFLEVMGYKTEEILDFLRPRPASTRNIPATEFNLPVGNGYAIANGPWAFEFNRPSSVVAGYHSYHSVGYYDYARGLPQYKNSPIPTKQYYDFLSTEVWGSSLQVIASDEDGDIILGGAIKEQGTGRPYGSTSSNIDTYTHGNGGEDNAGEGVQEVDTGIGLVGGPITNRGTISLAAATIDNLGGIIPGNGLTVDNSGVLSIEGSIGTVTSITAGIGLEGGVITTQGTIDLKPPTPPLDGQPFEIGGIYPNIGLVFNPDTGLTDVRITDDLQGSSKTTAISQYAANVLQQEISALVGANVLAGTFDASTGLMVTVSPAGAAKGFAPGQNVPIPTRAIDNYYVIVTIGGNAAKSPLPQGPAQAGDWYICQSEEGSQPTWLLIDFENASVVASSVVVTPPIPGIETAGNVQTALQAVELQVQDRIEFVQVQDEDNTNALFADVTPAVKTSYDGTTLKIGVNTADTNKFGVTKLTNSVTGTSQTLALSQFGANQLNAKVDALTGANVLAGTYNAKTGTVLTVTPAGSTYLTVNLNCPPATQVPDNYYVLVTVAGDKGPPGAIIPITGVQSGDWFVVEKEKGLTATWVTIDFENSGPILADQVRISPPISGLSSNNVQGALGEIVLKTNNAFTDIRSSTSNSSGIKVTNTQPTNNGRESTIQLMPATSQDIGGVFVLPDTGLQLTQSGGVGVIPATTTKIGGVVVGDGLAITPSGVLSVNAPQNPLTQVDDISAQFNGVKRAFDLTSGGRKLTPTNSYSLIVNLGGIIQTAVDAYVITGSQIIFSSPPAENLSFYSICFSGEVAFQRTRASDVPVKPIDSISIDFNGLRTTFNLTSGGIPLIPLASYTAMIALGGVWQTAGASYNIVGSTIEFTSPPETGTSFYGISFG